MPKFKITGTILRVSDAGTETLSRGSIIKEAADEHELRDQWFTDARQAFPDSPDYTIDRFCVVEPIESGDVLTETEPANLAHERQERNSPPPSRILWLLRFVLAFAAAVVVGNLLGRAFLQ